MAACLLWLSSMPALALADVNGELGLIYWNDSVSGSLIDGELDVGTFGVYGELWFGNKWGVRANYYNADFENTNFATAKHVTVDVKRRLLSATDNSYLAVGLGYDHFDLEGSGTASGFRLVTDGRLGLAGIVYAYGQFAWIPALGDVNGLNDVSATEWEFGLVLDPLPFVSVRAGYRIYDIDHSQGGTKSDGFLIGGGVHW